MRMMRQNIFGYFDNFPSALAYLCRSFVISIYCCGDYFLPKIFVKVRVLHFLVPNYVPIMFPLFNVGFECQDEVFSFCF